MGRILQGLWTGLGLLLSVAAQAASGVSSEPGEEGPTRAANYGVLIPDRAPGRSEGSGPYDELVIANVMLVNGEGAPPMGPVNIHVSVDRITRIAGGGEPEAMPKREILDAEGMYALPGFVDAHAHIGNFGQGLTGPVTPPEYIFKLWLAHGITTVRETGALMGLDWTLEHKRRSAEGSITAPRLVVHSMFPGTVITDPDSAREWVRAVHRKGADGVKLRGGRDAALTAVMEETQKLGMGTSHHHDQTAVYKVNVLTSARMGLDSMEHWYGLPEALFYDRTIQNYPPDYNYSDEQWRFGQAGRLWQQAAKPNSEHWNAVRDELLTLDFTLVPTFTIYEANRDVARARDAEWHAEYTWPGLQRFFMPDPRLHGSYHFDWTTADEVAWRETFRLWMTFVNDYKNHGGRVAAGSDAGFIFKLFGFAYIRELEMLQEA
ncbi:MAG: amidohydrolase, partial [Pseudomonadota bacterium]